jgi:hypothetical protein
MRQALEGLIQRYAPDASAEANDLDGGRGLLCAVTTKTSLNRSVPFGG